LLPGKSSRIRKGNRLTVLRKIWKEKKSGEKKETNHLSLSENGSRPRKNGVGEELRTEVPQVRYRGSKRAWTDRGGRNVRQLAIEREHRDL